MAKRTRSASALAASQVASSRLEGRLVHLTFFIGSEEYALPLGRVHEIVPQEGITRVPATPPFILGLLSLHGAAVPVIDLSRKFGAMPAGASDHRSILVVQTRLKEKNALVGVVIDRLGRVLRLAPEQIRDPPALDSLIAVEFLTGVFEGDGRFVLCIDVDRVLGADESVQVAELAQESTSAALETEVARLPFLTVRLAGERCALGLERLHEIIVCGRIARIPGTAPFVLGATNVRGSIVPVIDVARRYGLSATEQRDDSCLVLIEVGRDEREVPVGLLVEAVERLVHLTHEEIDRTPPFGTRFPGELVKGMAPVAGEFVPILDTDRALAPDDDARRTSGPATQVPITG